MNNRQLLALAFVTLFASTSLSPALCLPSTGRPEFRKFAEKPNALKKVSIDNNALDDVSTNQFQVKWSTPPSPEPFPEQINQESFLYKKKTRSWTVSGFRILLVQHARHDNANDIQSNTNGRTQQVRFFGRWSGFIPLGQHHLGRS